MDTAHEERSNYDVALRRWYKHFPQEQILIVNFKELQSPPMKLMTNTILPFLGVQPEAIKVTTLQDEASQQVNAGAYGSELRPTLRHKLEVLYRPHAHAFNLLLVEHGYTWRLDEYNERLRNFGH